MTFFSCSRFSLFIQWRKRAKRHSLIQLDISPDNGSFTDEIVHEYVKVEGKIGRLKGDLYHYSYRNISHHIEKVNDFTTLAARKMFEQGRRAGVLKIALYPFFEFLKVYLVKRGFLDGLAGLTISTLHAYYVFLKYAKLYELKSLRRGGNNP